jgi:hypothetical protein
MVDFIRIEDWTEMYDEEIGVYTPKNLNEVVCIPKDYEVISISFKSNNVLVRKIKETEGKKMN